MNRLLRSARESRGESTYTVAAAIGIHQSSYTRIENGVKKCSTANAKKLAAHFGNLVTRDQILYPEDYPDPAVRIVPRRRQLQEAA